MKEEDEGEGTTQADVGGLPEGQSWLVPIAMVNQHRLLHAQLASHTSLRLLERETWL